MAAVAFCLAALTDLFDGLLARRTNSVTNLGKLLDPMSDKLLVLTVLIFLVSMGRAPAWAVAVIVAREIAVTTLRGLAASKGVIMAASRWGKLKNLLQLSATTLLILPPSWYMGRINQLGLYLLFVAVFLTALSGIKYVVDYYRLQKSPY